MSSPSEVRSRNVGGREWKQLENKFFHSFEDAKAPREGRVVKWQGHVLSQPVDGMFLVELFEWLLGEASAVKLVPVEEMANWDFYLSDEEMRETWKAKYRRDYSDDDEESVLEQLPESVFN